MTVSAMKGDREKCLHAGMDDFVAKPVNSQSLIEKIEILLDRATHPNSQGVSVFWGGEKYEKINGNCNLDMPAGHLA